MGADFRPLGLPSELISLAPSGGYSVRMPANLLSATPLLHVSSSRDAERYYCDKLGFSKEWDYRPAAPAAEPGFLGLIRDGVRLDVSSFSGDGVAGGVVGFWVRDVDELYREFQARGVHVSMPPTDQTWGNREMYVRDPDGNALRFCQARA